MTARIVESRDDFIRRQPPETAKKALAELAESLDDGWQVGLNTSPHHDPLFPNTVVWLFVATPNVNGKRWASSQAYDEDMIANVTPEFLLAMFKRQARKAAERR